MRFRLHSSKSGSKKGGSVHADQKDCKKHKKHYDIKYKYIGEKRIKIKEWHDNDGIPLTSPEAQMKIDENLSPKERKKAEKLLKKAKKAQKKAEAKKKKAILQQKKARFKRRHGDRPDGRRVRGVNGMQRFMPFIMKDRCDAQNTYSDSFDITELEKFCREKVKSGMTNFSILHVFLASYVRVVSQRPAVNRFISGQEIFSRYEIEVVMTVKKTMSLDSADTCIKVIFEPTDTIDEVYKKFNDVVEKSIGPNADTDFDNFANAFKKIPRWLFRFAVWLLTKLDYRGWLPKSLLDISPFHGSMIITSMGSLGIKPIYHHIYNFGNLPVFLAYGMKRSVISTDKDGKVTKKRYVDLKAVTDERICDGYYFASAFKLFKKYVEDPRVLETPPEEVFDDIL